MRVFVTGATGFIGSAVVQELLGAGHQVVGLARNDEGAAKLAAWGVETHRGDIADPEGLAAAAKDSDGVIHLAFGHDFSQFAANIAANQKVVDALVGALEGSGKPLVIASGTMMVSHARPATEDVGPASADVPRGAAEMAVLGAAERGVRGVVVRLSPSVHDVEAQGLVSYLIQMAREKGVSPYVGEGANVWPAVHRLDAARLFHLALEKAKPGTRLHAAAESGIPMREIAEAVGEGLGLPARSITSEEAPAHFGFFAFFTATDNPTSSAITRETMGWVPTGPGLLEGLRSGAYMS